MAGLTTHHIQPIEKCSKEGGYPLTPDGKLTDELIHELFLYGDEDAIRKRLYAMHAAGVDEVVTGISPVRDADTNWHSNVQY